MKGRNIITTLRKATGFPSVLHHQSPYSVADGLTGLTGRDFYWHLLEMRNTIRQLPIQKLFIALDATEQSINAYHESRVDLFLFVNDHIHNNTVFQESLGQQWAWMEHLEMVLAPRGLSVRLGEKVFPNGRIQFSKASFLGQDLLLPDFEVQMQRGEVFEAVQRVFPQAFFMSDGIETDTSASMVRFVSGNGGIPPCVTEEIRNGILVVGNAPGHYRQGFNAEIEEKNVSVICVANGDVGRRESELIGLRDIVQELRISLGRNIEIVFFDEQEKRGES